MRNQPIYTQTIEHGGASVLIEYFPDYDADAPWDKECGHGPIREIGRSRYVRPSKKPGEVLLDNGMGDYWAYDFQGAIAQAHEEGWGLGDEDIKALARKLGRSPTKGEIVAESVRQDMQYLSGWLRDEWSYVGIVCTLLDADGEKTEYTDSCWGFETFKDYHETAGRKMAKDLAESVAREKRKQFVERMREARERKYWASRDVETVGA